MIIQFIVGCQHPEPVIRLANLSYEQLALSRVAGGTLARQLQDSRQSFADSISIQTQGAESLSERTTVITRDWADAGSKKELTLLERMRIDDLIVLKDPYAPFRESQPHPIPAVTVDLTGLDKAITGVDKLRTEKQDWAADEAFDFSKTLVEEAAKDFAPKSTVKK